LRALTPHEVIVEMLRSYNDVCGPGERGEGSDRSDDRLLLMHPLWSQGSYAELYRAMYELRSQQVRLEPGDRYTLWWHVAERYLRVQKRITEGCPGCGQATRKGTRHEHKDGSRNRRYDRGLIVQEVHRSEVDLKRVERGVDWLVREHRGPPMLPAELYLLVAA
jgi:hypothetical protein